MLTRLNNPAGKYFDPWARGKYQSKLPIPGSERSSDQLSETFLNDA